MYIELSTAAIVSYIVFYLPPKLLLYTIVYNNNMVYKFYLFRLCTIYDHFLIKYIVYIYYIYILLRS